MVIILEEKATSEDIKEAGKEFGDYIKIVVDIETGLLAAGGKLHADCEKALLEADSRQEDLWGGGFDMTSGHIDTQAIVNIRPNLGNDSMEILDEKIRQKFLKIAERIMK